MALESLQKLYNGVTSQRIDIGDFDTFKTKMQNPKSRRSFYDQVSGLGIDIGDYETFELKVSSPVSHVSSNEFFVDPDEVASQQDSFKQGIYDSVKRQENSVAKNNPYGVNLPRKKSNVDKIQGLGGRVMQGSQTLLEFDSLENGVKAGEEIIDNILSATSNDPSKFYSSYSGLPEDSPEVKSFVEIFNENKQKATPKQESNLDRIMRALEQGKNNPQYIMKTASEPDAVERLVKSVNPLPKFVMGIPTSEIPTEQIKRREKLTPKQIAEAQNKLFLQREIAKEKKENGLSERDAYRKVVSSAGGTPPSVVDLAMEKSITGAVFRIMNLDQKTMLVDYPQAEIEEISDMVSVDFLEQVVSGAVSMVMPVDAMLFGVGGKAGAKVGQKAIETLPKLKTVAKYADEAANKISKGFNVPLPQVRVLAKEAVSRITGGAGGFGAFDAGRNIAEQIETTGELDVVEALEALLTGIAIGGSVGSLGLAGAKAGNFIGGGKGAKVGEFSMEVVGLGTVAPVLEGEPITKQGYVEAAGTIIGLKFLKQFSAENQRRMTESLGEEIQRRTEQSGKRMDEVANEIGNRLKTSFELAIEGKSPEKFRSVMIDKGMEFDLSVKRTEKPLSEDPLRPLRITDVLVSEKVMGLKGVKEPGSVEYTPRNQNRPERMQIESDIRRLASDMKTLEKNGVQQKVLDDMQNRIDARVAKLNEIAVERKDIENLFIPPETLRQTQRKVVSTEQVAREVVERRTQFQQRVEGLESQLASRDRAEQKRLDTYLKEKEIYNRPFEPNPLLAVPLHPADAGRRAIEAIKKPKLTVQQLPAKDKLKGYQIQKEFTDLDLTVKANQQALQNPNLTPIQKQNLERSGQKAKELLNDVKERAEVEGVELQMFMGIPTPSILKSLFGSSKKRPRNLREAEVDRLYNQAIERLDNKIKNEGITVEPKEPVSVEPIKPQGFGEKVYNVFFSDLIERTANVGTPTSIRAAESGRRAIDITKETYGRLAPTLDVILSQSGKMFGAEGKAVRELSEFVEVNVGGGNTVLMSKLHAGIEGYPVKLSKQAKKQLEPVKNLIEERGKIYEEIGLMQEGADGKVKPFKVLGRNIAPRIMSGEFYTIIQRGPSTNEFNTLVSEFAKANGAPEKQVRDYFNEFRDNFTGSGGLTLQGGVPANRPTRTTQAEHSRKWKHIPHAIKVGKDLIPIVEHRPFEYARRLAETGSSRVGVTKVFGQELAGTSTINKIKDQLSNEKVSVAEFHEMIKGLSGVPIEPSLIAGTSKGVRAINAAYDVLKTTSLSASAIPNLGEFLGSTRRFAGTTGLVKALSDLRLGLPTAKAKQLEAYMDSIGAITKDVANFSIDPNRPISSFVRALNEAQRSAFVYRYMNQLQEATAAVVAFNKVETYKQGKGKNIDKIFLREMGFSRQDASFMVSGKAPQRLYDALIRRAPAHLTGGAQRVGEQSRAESSRIFKAVTAFETYAQMKIRSLNRVAKTYGAVTREAFSERNYSKAVDAHRAMFSEIYGLAISGLTAQFALSYFYGGEDNVEIKYNEAMNNPFRALKDAWTYTAFGGIYGQILKATGGDVGIDRLYPVTVIRETIGAVTGTGRYTYDEGMDRAIKFTERFAPANKAFKNGLVAMGFGSPEAKKTDNAISAYYRWKIENKYGGKYTSVPDENIKKFRTNMIKAYKAFREQKGDKEVLRLSFNAVSESGKDIASISRSLTGKKLLTKSKIAPGSSDPEFTKRKNELKKRIGQKAFNRLVIHDQLLDLLADLF